MKQESSLEEGNVVVQAAVEIQDHELEYLGISRQAFAEREPSLQKRIKDFAKDGLKKQLQQEAANQERRLQLGFCDTFMASRNAGDMKAGLAVDGFVSGISQ